MSDSPTKRREKNAGISGDTDMRIAADGTWFYCGSPIGRAPLVQLFASILRKDGDRYVLVTPVERVGIIVDDAPFLAVEMRREDAAGEPRLVFRTNVEDEVAVDAEHPLRFETGAADGVKPYVKVRGELWALVKRALFYDLVALGVGNQPYFGEHRRLGDRPHDVLFIDPAVVAYRLDKRLGQRVAGPDHGGAGGDCHSVDERSS